MHINVCLPDAIFTSLGLKMSGTYLVEDEWGKTILQVI